MNSELFLRRYRGPRSAEEWIVFIIAVAVGLGIDSFLGKKFPEMSRRQRRAFSYIPMIAILLVYLFLLKE